MELAALRQTWRRACARAFAYLFLSLLAACAREPETMRFSGATMGTTWHATVVDAPSSATRLLLQQDIDAVLARIDLLMSTWREDSEISRFNRAAEGEWFAIAPETLAVLHEALRVNRESDGAFDVTIAPLLAAWGFGPRGSPHVPGEGQVQAALAQVGSQALELEHDPPRLRKTAPRAIELSAIAPGYAVDLVAEAFVARGVRNFLVEIGGEVRTAGRNPAGGAWTIGIERPDAPPGTPALAIELHDVAVSTSGDYREFFEADGRRYSHTFDPHTGRPVTHTLASVTVIAGDCMRADALATALAVLGPDAGMTFAERKRLPVYMLLREPGGGFAVVSSSAFAPYLETAQPVPSATKREG